MLLLEKLLHYLSTQLNYKYNILILLHLQYPPYIFTAMRQLTQLLENDFLGVPSTMIYTNLIQIAYKIKHPICFVQS